jgi:hypothetical protein
MKTHHGIKILAAMSIAFAATTLAAPTGVTINGFALDDAVSTGDIGWAYDSSTYLLTLDGAGPFTLSGTNTEGKVLVVVAPNVANTVTLSNLTLQTTSSGQCAFALEANANVAIVLAGENTLASGSYRAGIEVATGQTLSITNAPGDDAGSLSATGGYGGDGGAVTVSGGTVAATGGNYGAGIGGGRKAGYGGAGGTVTISGGTVAATGGYTGAGIGGGTYGDGGAVTVYGGLVVATGGDEAGAGIGGGDGGAGGTLWISGGTVTANGSFYGAGIGGGTYGAGGTVNVSGGTVTANSGDYGAGIGGGAHGAGGTVNVSGGTVKATGNYGAGIGGGWQGAGGHVNASGGTVKATSNYGADIGSGKSGAVSGANTITGGSIGLANATIAPAPSNNTARVACVKVANLDPNMAVAITGLTGYGVNDIVADDAGTIHLWLPDGDYDFTVNGLSYTIKLKNGVGPSGVTVNGEEAAFGPADPGAAGWSFNVETHAVSLSGTGPFTLSGVNKSGDVCFVVPEGVTNTIRLSNLTLLATNDNQCAFALETNACVSLVLAGANTLASGANHAGLEVSAGAATSITNAPGDDAGSLTATGGENAAGIGSGGYQGDWGGYGSAGTIRISGGTVVATGDWGGAGIGGGYHDRGGTVEITGGSVTATGGAIGGGIGGGAYLWDNGDCVVIIAGGTVTATGCGGGAGIGGGCESAGGTVEISGGAVTATGAGDDMGTGGAGIGGGYYGGSAAVTISGGTITAVGNDLGAGIGGGGGWDAIITVAISGGCVLATGGDYAAGIGGGSEEPGGTVTISGGRVTATGGDYAPGIGGGSSPWGDGGEGATLAVSGGTVLATGGAKGGVGIGGGIGDLEDGGTTPNVSGTSTFTGGSIRIDGGYAAAAPSNGAERVWCVTVPNLTPNAPVEIALPAESLPATFGVNDLVADAAGKLYLWLPDGSYAFTADGAAYTATVANAPTTATQGSSGGPAAPVFATDGSGFAFDGTSFSIKITNAQSGIWYSLYAADTLGGTWEIVESVCAENDGDLVFDNLDATAPSRFFKVEASATQP